MPTVRGAIRLNPKLGTVLWRVLIALCLSATTAIDGVAQDNDYAPKGTTPVSEMSTDDWIDPDETAGLRARTHLERGEGPHSARHGRG